MRKKALILLSVLFLTIACLAIGRQFLPSLNAQNEEERLGELNKQIQEYQQKVKDLQSQSNTLANQIAQFDAQISLAQLKIEQTKEQINLLIGRIDRLQGSLESLSNAFTARVQETYKLSRMGEPVTLIISAGSLSDAVSRLQYLKKLQTADQNLLSKLQNAQNIYKTDKSSLEDLQKSLEDQKKQLDVQKAAKAQLLAITKNDEKKYQNLLAQAKSEMEAIQAIIAGRGKETHVGHVDEGQKIATIIDGPSCNSSGSHTHFIVGQSGKTLNPFNYLKPGIDYENCSGSSCGSSDGDSFNPTGSWNWPIQPKIHFAQGYGVTWAVRNTWAGRVYNFHNGIDINSDSAAIFAVQSGELYRGSYSGTNGCQLRYVRVNHDNSDLETYFLHVNF